MHKKYANVIEVIKNEENTFNRSKLLPQNFVVCIGSQGGLMKRKTESKLLERQVCSML